MVETYLRFWMLVGTGTDAGVGGPELDRVIIPGRRQDHLQISPLQIYTLIHVIKEFIIEVLVINKLE